MKFYFVCSKRDIFFDILSEEKVKKLLFSFYWIRGDIDLEKMKQEGIDIFIDSGGYSARKQGKNIDVKKYGKFLERNKEFITTAANLDVMKLEEAQENQKYLETVFPILPVYHVKEYLEGKKSLFEEWCQKYPYLAVGGIAGVSLSDVELKNFLNFCFRTALKYKTKIHGFGINSPDLVLRYPFYSVDSTVWLKGGQFGTVIKWENYKLKSSIHCSDEERYKEFRLPVKLTESYKNRLHFNIKEILKMEQDITKLWKSRGIVWN